ncbi:DUF4017 family protein [Bacillus testis]|uniref:DUF4017 family protein n=1 Tax=Bacillus testis TaxID=1622072 RepID=UPI00067EE4E5|nr:DUF4017 family protein [Bacillus testis]
MRLMIPPLIAYIIVCVIAVFIPASEGYHTILWKLTIGQIYALPTLLIVTLASYYVNKRKSHC